MNYQRFFSRDARTVAKDLLGRLLVRTEQGGTTAGRIIEMAAFEDDEDRKSRSGMLYAPGTIYVMPFRGNHFLNIATGRKYEPSCVLIRQVALHDRVLNGPGKVGNFFDVEYLDGELLGKDLRVEGEPVPTSKIERVTDGNSGNCLGYYRIKG